MKEELTAQVMQGMIKILDNAQMRALQKVLKNVLEGYTLAENECNNENDTDLIDVFISAKRVEGCSEKTLNYYSTTIQTVVESIGKDVRCITT